MIEPYAPIIHLHLDNFRKIGFFKLAESDYSVEFSDGENVIEISTEKYYHPSLTARLIDSSDKKFSIRLIREIIAPDELSKDSSKLDSIRKKYDLDNENIDASKFNQGVAAYASVAINQLLHFLSSHKNQILSGSYKPAYVAKEADILKNIGL